MSSRPPELILTTVSIVGVVVVAVAVVLVAWTSAEIRSAWHGTSMVLLLGDERSRAEVLSMSACAAASEAVEGAVSSPKMDPIFRETKLQPKIF